MPTLFDNITADPEVREFLELTDQHLGVIGYTEHGFRHAEIVAQRAGDILGSLHYPPDTVQLARIAGYLHDLGNFVCRTNHGPSGAMLLLPLLRSHNLGNQHLGWVLSAIGNHEEEHGSVSNPVSAAVVIADKSDVHRSRVRKYNPEQHDIHDQVNFAVTHSQLAIAAEQREVRLELEIDSTIATVMDYFEIFLIRMNMCKAAAQFLECKFHILCNGTLLT